MEAELQRCSCEQAPIAHTSLFSLIHLRACFEQCHSRSTPKTPLEAWGHNEATVCDGCLPWGARTPLANTFPASLGLETQFCNEIYQQLPIC